MITGSIWAVAAGALVTIVATTAVDHVMILGAVGVVLATAGVVATWNLGLGPRWYPISLAVLALPQCWVGGKVYEWQSAKISSNAK